MEFIKNRLKSLQYVFQGVYYLVKNEPPVIVHILTSLAHSAIMHRNSALGRGIEHRDRENMRLCTP